MTIPDLSSSKPDLSQLRFALLQVRNLNDPVRSEERTCFANQIRVQEEQITCVDVLGTELGPQTSSGVDAILVGGSGEFSVVNAAPPIRKLIDFLGATAEAGFPTFASCFGFQALVLALGGEVITDAKCAEVGTFSLHTTDAASADPLFGSLPATFFAQEGHKDRATRLPAGATCLAASDLTPFQAFRWRQTNVWATQFHPEMNEADNRLRVERYADRYKKESEAALLSSRPSPEACALLHRFALHLLPPASSANKT